MSASGLSRTGLFHPMNGPYASHNNQKSAQKGAVTAQMLFFKTLMEGLYCL
jgi:hypothetical protein